MAVDDTSLWLMVVGVFTAVIGIGLAYVMYTVASLQRTLLRLQTDVTHMGRRIDAVSGAGGPMPSVSGDAPPKGGTGQPRLESLAVATSSAPAAPLQEQQQQQLQPSQPAALAAASSVVVPVEEWMQRLRQLENDVGALTQRLAHSTSHSPLHLESRGDGTGGDRADGGAGNFSSFSSPHKKPSALFQEIVAEMTRSAGPGATTAAAAAVAASTVVASTPSPRVSVSRGPRLLQSHNESTASMQIADLSPLPNVSDDMSRVMAVPSPRSGPLARRITPLETPAPPTATPNGRGVPAAASAPPFPLPVPLLLVGEVPRNFSMNPVDDVPPLSVCSHFVRSTVSLVSAADGDGGATLVVEPMGTTSSSSANGGNKGRATTTIRIPLRNVACLHVALDTLPGVATECVVLVFVPNSGPGVRASSQRTLRRLPPPTRSSQFQTRRQSSVHVMLGDHNPVDGEDSTTEDRVVLCADTHDADVSRFVDFLCSCLDGRVRHVTTSDHSLL